MDFLTKCEFEEGTYYEAISSQHCANEIKAISLSIDVDNMKENNDTTHRSNGGMKLSKLNSHSPKMTSNSLTTSSKRSPMKTASQKLSPIRSPLGDLSSNSHSPKRSPKKETRRGTKSTSIEASPKKREIVVMPSSRTSILMEEVAAAGIVELNTTQPKRIVSTPTTAVVTIIPMSDIVSESIAPSCCDVNDNWNHYQAISNYCFEKLSTINDVDYSVGVWSDDDIVQLNINRLATERLNSTDEMREVNQDSTMKNIAMESLEATNAQLVNALSTQTQMISTLKSYNMDLEHIISSLTVLMHEKDMALNDASQFDEMNNCANTKIVTSIHNKYKEETKAKESYITNLHTYLRIQRRTICTYQTHVSVLQSHVDDKYLNRSMLDDIVHYCFTYSSSRVFRKAYNILSTANVVFGIIIPLISIILLIATFLWQKQHMQGICEFHLFTFSFI